MQTVVETLAYLRSAKSVGMTAAEMRAAVDLIAANPSVGDLIVGSGGCRKVRIAGRGKCKSGGYRLVTYFAGKATPAFLLAVLSKGSDANFSAAQIASMRAATDVLIESLGPLAGKQIGDRA